MIGNGKYYPMELHHIQPRVEESNLVVISF